MLFRQSHPQLIIHQLYLFQSHVKEMGLHVHVKVACAVETFLSPSSVRNRELKPGRRRPQRELTSSEL